jgi:CSLREA domain-containing protein
VSWEGVRPECSSRGLRAARQLAFVATLLGIAIGANAGAASAATITVNSTADDLISAPDDGDCALREAVEAAHTNAAVDQCQAGDPSGLVLDTIELGPGTYQVSLGVGDDTNEAGDLDVFADVSGPGSGPLRIDGTAPGVTIDALANNGNDDRAIDGRTGNLTISDLTVTGGRAFGQGGGIRSVGGNLTLTNVTVTDNQAIGAEGGGVFHAPSSSSANLTVTDSRITQNTARYSGGGISTGANSALDLTGSLVSGNQLINNSDGSSTRGGGVFALEEAEISDSMISGNTVTVGLPTGVASPDGGGVAFENPGTGRSRIFNSTISGNQVIDARLDQMLSPAAGGVYNSNNGELFVVNSTIVGNTVSGDAPGGSTAWGGGGLFTSSSSETAIVSSTIAANEAPRADALGRFFGAGIRLKNSIVDDQDGDVTDTCGFNTGAFLATDGHNIAMGTTCVNGVTDPSDLASTIPQLGSLGSFGGPTQTILPASTSPAIDLVPVAACDDGDSPPNTLSEDQRHLLRPFDFAGDSTADCDAGAVERRPSDLVAPTPPPAALVAPSNVFTVGKLKGMKLTLTVPGPGAVVVNDAQTGTGRAIASAGPKLLKHSSATAAAAGKVIVTLKLTKKGKQKLADKGKVRVKAAITFTPSGGTPRTTTKKLKVKS